MCPFAGFPCIAIKTLPTNMVRMAQFPLFGKKRHRDERFHIGQDGGGGKQREEGAQWTIVQRAVGVLVATTLC